jgi:Helix-turn-helix of insertion element transposase
VSAGQPTSFPRRFRNARPQPPTHAPRAGLLASGHSLSEICQLLKIGRATCYRWRQQPSFVAYLNELQQDAADQARCQSLALLTQSLALIQSTLNDPATPLALRLKLSFRLLSLYSKPSYLRPVQKLLTNPLLVEDRQMREELIEAGDTTEHLGFAPDERELYRCFQEGYLEKAIAFDQTYPDPQALIAPLLAQSQPQQPAPATPARDEMRQNETGRSTGDALDAALAGLRQQIAKAVKP